MNNKLHTPLTDKGLPYTWRQLAQRAGITGGNPQGTGFEALGISVYYAHPDQVQAECLSIIVVPCAEGAWQKLLERPQKSLDWRPARETIPNSAELPFDDLIPVLFWGEGYEKGNKPFAQQRDDGSIVFYADIVAATFFMLTRWEETVVPTRDMHERFPAIASVAYKQGFLDRPIVDEYGLILRAWLKILLPNWEPEAKEFSLKLSHDIDTISYAAGSWSRALRLLGGDLLKRRSVWQAWQTVDALRKQVMTPEQDVYLQGIYTLADLSSQHELHSAFYFMATEPRTYDVGYDPASRYLQPAIDELRQQGHEIGFHPGYYTYNDSAQFAKEKDRLERALGEKVYGGRQHYLRFRVPDTWRLWEENGLTYESTLGYADHEGFRCGTCHPFHPYDVERGREMELVEVPLIVMDASLRLYRKFDVEQGKCKMLQLKRRCEQVGGEFTVLWHNSCVYGTGKWLEWFKVYQEIVKSSVDEVLPDHI